MFKKYTLIFFLFSQLWTQPSANIQFEILTESLTIGEDPYTIQVALQVASSQEIDHIEMVFDSLKIKTHITAAELNGESIWLLRSEDRSENDKVLAWMYDNKESKLNIYPNTWTTPYRLVLDIQITMMREEALTAVLRASAQINNSLLPCRPAGRGNAFSLIQ
jgi:hypothetical protein